MAKKEIRHIDISKIESPEFVKELNYKELEVLCADIRNYILDVTADNGGHVASNLGVVEATVALCRNFDFSKDKIIFDVGHQCYTYKVLTGRSLDNLRKKDGVSGFQKLNESPYDHFECGHSSTSISVATGLATARDLNNEKYDVVAFIGDSSISNGLAYEGLNHLASCGHKVIIVLNDNNMSISRPVGGMSSMFRKFSSSGVYIRSKNVTRKMFQGTRFGRWCLRCFSNFKNWVKRKVINLTPFESIGFKMIGPVDGHYIKHLDQAFAKAKKVNCSVIVHIKTIKGKGYPYAENDETGAWHGVSKFEKETGKIFDDGQISWSEQYKDILKDEMAINDKIITIVPATEHGSALDPLFELYPERMIDVGIAEEHALTMAGGLAASGFYPVVSIYSTFLQRAYDELFHDIARMNLNATVLVDRAGLVGADGDTHQGIYDEAFLYTIPNVSIAMASRVGEALSLMKESFNKHGVFVIRYPRECIKDTEEKVTNIPFGGWLEELKGSDVAIVATGPVVVDLKEELCKLNKKVSLYNAIYLRPIDEEKIKNLLSFKKIIIYNPYATAEGFANALTRRLAELNYHGQIITKVVPTLTVEQASIEEQRAKFGLSIKDICDLI